MKKLKILVSGASIAGLTSAYWLNKKGFEVTIVEKASKIRGGGYPIDVRGSAINIVKMMGIYEELKAQNLNNMKFKILDNDNSVISQFTDATMKANEDIADKLFEENGYDKTSMDKIAKESGVSRRTLFRYFESKSEILFLSNNDLLKNTLDEFLDGSYTLESITQKLINVLDNASHEDKVNYMESMKRLKTEPDFQSQILYKILKILPQFPSSESDSSDVLKGALFGNILVAWSKIIENPTVDSLDLIKEQIIEFQKRFLEN